jgi:predicted dithiol-disulfide oxidoreductase (DUF899 family)
MKHKVVGNEDFLKAHAAFLKAEKEMTHQRDALAIARRELPWMLVEKSYVFEGRDGKTSLADLFAGKSQLIVQHFMMGPGWKAGCEGCSFMADHVDAALVHLRQRDVSYVAISRAPLTEIQSYQKRMGWHFPWFSSNETDFNFDFHVSFTDEDKARGTMFYNYREDKYSGEEQPGMSVFYKDETGKVFHTYSTFGRGNEQVMGTYVLLDMLPKGRDEVPFKEHPMEWVRRHDEYDDAKKPHSCH